MSAKEKLQDKYDEEKERGWTTKEFRDWKKEILKVRIQDFKERIIDQMPGIVEITEGLSAEEAFREEEKYNVMEKHPFLFPYIRAILNLIKRYEFGIFFMDPKGIYTPIEEGFFGVIHLARLPRKQDDVFCLTDLRDCAKYDHKGRIIILQGVFRTRDYGYKFISDDFFITPVLGVSPVIEKEFSYDSGEAPAPVIEEEELLAADAT